MNENKKGFNLFPEYVWMIFVGMLLVILFLTNAIPGHAEEVTPIPTPAVEDPRYNYATYLFAQNNSVFILGPDHSFIELPSPHDYQVNNNTEALERLRLDYVRSLDTLFDFIPAAETTIYYADENASIGTLNFLISVLDPFDCYFMYEYSESAYVPDYSDSTQYTFISAPCGPYNIGVYKKNTLIVPSATPTPAPDPDIYYFKFTATDWYNTYYYMVSFEASGLGVSFSFPVNDSFISYIANQNSFDPSDFSGTAFVYRSGMSSTWNQPTYEKPAIAFYFTSSGYSNFKLYSIPNSTAYEYDPEVIAQTYTPTSVGSSDTDYVRTYDYSYSGVSCFLFSQELRANNNYRFGSYALGSVYGFDYTYQEVNSTAAWFNDGVRYNLGSGVQDKVNFAYYGFLGLLGKLEDVDNPNGPTPTLAPTVTPEPLPTSGESIHVILPSGTPTPTPPFSVPGGSDGGTGSGSPGSIGSGLSSQQTSGILEYWSSFVSDNPAMLFLTSTFQALPQELLYPLYILLFILLLLAVIRLFVHFSGG